MEWMEYLYTPHGLYLIGLYVLFACACAVTFGCRRCDQMS